MTFLQDCPWQATPFSVLGMKLQPKKQKLIKIWTPHHPIIYICKKCLPFVDHWFSLLQSAHNIRFLSSKKNPDLIFAVGCKIKM